ncbi:unnamed protein product [Arctia plantaginis]|uniref:Uncharacterized protein n=1 Tax=Arctia plantaginis TaxID=874455 RepID=A0A8S1BIG3_ARCPL|nr:unnamed protein product [Arctia plantaginis]
MSESDTEHTASSQPADHGEHHARRTKGVSSTKVEPAEVHRVALRLPPFWPEEPDICNEVTLEEALQGPEKEH